VDPERVRPLVQRLQEFVGSLCVVTCHLVRRGNAYAIVEVHRVQRAQSQRSLEMRERRLRAGGIDLQLAKSALRPGCIRVQRHRTFKQDTGSSKIPPQGVDGSQNGQDERVVLRQHRSAFRKRERPGLGIRDFPVPSCRRTVAPSSRPPAPAGSPGRVREPLSAGRAQSRSPPSRASRHGGRHASCSHRRQDPAAACAERARSPRGGSTARSRRPPFL